MVRLHCVDYETKYKALKSSLMTFFNDPRKWDLVYKYIQNDEKSPSMRLWDFFVTIYAKNNKCVYVIKDPSGNERIINVWKSAQMMLKNYKKKHFDPFKRKNVVIKDHLFLFGYGDKKIMTSVSQLCFFRWAVTEGVIDYLEKNLEDIKQAQSEHHKKQRSRSSKKTRRTDPLFIQESCNHKDVAIPVPYFSEDDSCSSAGTE